MDFIERKGFRILDVEPVESGGKALNHNFSLDGDLHEQHTAEIAAVRANMAYRHVQSVPAITWTITHNLNRAVAFVVYNSFDEEVWGDVHWLNNNSFNVTFKGAFSGKVEVS